MSTWYRVAQTEQIDTVFSGDGGLYVAGRWHHQGKKVVYCSDSIALCTLEWLAHNGLFVSDFSYHRFSIHIADPAILSYTQSALPKNWHTTPATTETRQFADTYLFGENKPLAMAVPSVMVPEALNLIINPLHPAYANALKTVCYLGKYVAPHRVM